MSAPRDSSTARVRPGIAGAWARDAAAVGFIGPAADTAEHRRLADAEARRVHWRRWGPYVSERAWGTVREDYSPDGRAWHYFPYEHARLRAYRWNEDGIAGLCDRHQRICVALSLWNERDATLKERLFGLNSHDGNHGEDVKEYYYHLDNTPTHSYMRYLYKYPQAAFPYDRLRDENRSRDRGRGEFELVDTGVFDQDRYFDVEIEYAKAGPEDIVIRITATNRGPDAAPLHLLPTIWFRNTWSWGEPGARPSLRAIEGSETASIVALEEPQYGARWLWCDGSPAVLVTDNDTNFADLFGVSTPPGFSKDGIDAFVVRGRHEAVNPAGIGTKAAAHYRSLVPPGMSMVCRLRLTDTPPTRGLRGLPTPSPADRTVCDAVVADRRRDADEFFASLTPATLGEDARLVMRQSLAGLLWSKQFYHYDVRRWLDGDARQPAPPDERRAGRNREWEHLYNADVISMPDKWEYPWYAAWDLAFHTIPLALVDPDFAKDQLLLMLREWYMHPNGQLPAYEWALGDVNPPVHAWAAWRVYKIEKKRRGRGDRQFLARVFQKLLLNFTWWVNRKDTEGRNVFQGGFLGLDNIGVFDRSSPLPTGGHLEQSDGTSWMAMYSLNLLAIAMELASEDPSYEDVASKFWEHFLYIANAMGSRQRPGTSLWDEQDGLFYDVLHLPDGSRMPMKIRSMVGLIPLFAVETLEPEALAPLSGFKRRLEWFMANRPDLTAHVSTTHVPGRGERRLLSVVDADQLRRILHVMLDEREFLSPFGIRALSRYHREHPYVLTVDGVDHRVDYEPAESQTGLFGGNSNWRGPVWFPVNFLLIESLQKFHRYFGDEFRVECPTGSGRFMNLWDVSLEISRRLSSIFLADANGRRPVNGGAELFHRPEWCHLVPFHEYFHGDEGWGIGASHQTGWTGLVAKLLQQAGTEGEA
ncbi:MAG: hypothetical protein U0Q12_20800 [Vicinamibacterales bacterium]